MPSPASRLPGPPSLLLLVVAAGGCRSVEPGIPPGAIPAPDRAGDAVQAREAGAPGGAQPGEDPARADDGIDADRRGGADDARDATRLAETAAELDAAEEAEEELDEAIEELEEERLDEIVELLEDGDWEAARTAIDEVLVERYLIRARAQLAAGSPADALVAIDEILAVDPTHAEARLLKARGSMALAEQRIAAGRPRGLVEGALEDALEYYRLASRTEPSAVFGASRAAHLLGDTDEALRWARRGQRLLEEGEIREGVLQPLPQRTVAEALCSAYTRARAEEAGADGRTQELYFETEEALASLLGRAVDDAWVWARFSDIYEGEGRFDLARRKVETGLLRLPDDPGLLERLARVTRKESGAAGVIAAFEGYVEANPRVALGHWYLGLEVFDDALERLDDGDAGAFRRAEAEFRRCRELDDTRTAACLGYEVMCRDARGWCALQADELETATKEFLSMSELIDRGIEWRIEGRLTDGVMGLAVVGDQYNSREDWLSAGVIFERAHRIQPDEVLWARKAGFHLRDAALEMELAGSRLCRAAHGEISDEESLAELRALAGIDPASAGGDDERRLLADAANRTMREARSLMQRSGDAYRAAAALAPDDIRIVNDAARVLLYYLGEDLDQAEQYLQSCLDLGASQVAELEQRLDDPTLAPEARDDLEGSLWELENAWGDAHQNLAVLEYLRGDASAAARLATRAVEIGPDPRPDLTNHFLPLIRGDRPPTSNELFPIDGWAQPCDTR